MVDDFGGAMADVVHPADPFELVIGFELFGDVVGLAYIVAREVSFCECMESKSAELIISCVIFCDVL